MEDEKKKEEKAGFVVIKRKVGEGVLIGDAMMIVVKVDGNFVKMAIKAPKDIKISRFSTEEPK